MPGINLVFSHQGRSVEEENKIRTGWQMYLTHNTFFCKTLSGAGSPSMGNTHCQLCNSIFFSLWGHSPCLLNIPQVLFRGENYFLRGFSTWLISTTIWWLMQAMKVASSPQELRPVAGVSMLCVLIILDALLEMLWVQHLGAFGIIWHFLKSKPVTQGKHDGLRSFSNSFWNWKHRRERLPSLSSSAYTQHGQVKELYL